MIAYGALFVLLGLWVRRALIWGLAYILLWEGFVAIAGDNAQRLAIRSYTRSLLSDATGVDLCLADIDVSASVIVPLVVAAVAFALTTWRLRKMEVADPVPVDRSTVGRLRRALAARSRPTLTCGRSRTAAGPPCASGSPRSPR